MSTAFPSEAWLTNFQDKLNSDQKYAGIAKNWEGDLCFVVEPDPAWPEKVILYLDLWHGTCRKAFVVPNGQEQPSAFTLYGEYTDFLHILKGELHPIQAMATMKLKVRGNYGYIMRNVPVVLDFVRCAQEVTQF